MEYHLYDALKEPRVFKKIVRQKLAIVALFVISDYIKCGVKGELGHDAEVHRRKEKQGQFKS
jgi:hypothetical protein